MEALSHRYEQYWTYLYYTYLSDDPLPSFLVGKHPSPRDWVSTCHSLFSSLPFLSFLINFFSPLSCTEIAHARVFPPIGLHRRRVPLNTNRLLKMLFLVLTYLPLAIKYRYIYVLL